MLVSIVSVDPEHDLQGGLTLHNAGLDMGDIVDCEVV